MTEEPGATGATPLSPGRGSLARRWTAIAIALVLVGGGAAYLLTRPEDGAGPLANPSRIPARALEGDFCHRYAALVYVHDGQSVLDWAAAMAEIGTPSDLSGPGRAGFVVVLKRAARVDKNATAEDLVRRVGTLGDAEARNVKAFTDYAASTCAGELESALGGAGSTGLVP